MNVRNNRLTRWSPLAVFILSLGIVVPAFADTGDLRVTTEKVDGRSLADARLKCETYRHEYNNGYGMQTRIRPNMCR